MSVNVRHDLRKGKSLEKKLSVLHDVRCLEVRMSSKMLRKPLKTRCWMAKVLWGVCSRVV